MAWPWRVSSGLGCKSSAPRPRSPASEFGSVLRADAASPALSSDPGAQNETRTLLGPGWPTGSRRSLRSRQRAPSRPGCSLTRPGALSAPRSEDLQTLTPP